MRRREAIAAIAAQLVTVGGLGNAQVLHRGAPRRVSIVDDAQPTTRAELWTSFRARLRELGYVEDRAIRIDERFAGGDIRRLEAMAFEVVASKPDVVVTVTTTAAVALRKATRSIPIVALGPADPVRSGLVESLARPGGNVTGMAPNQAEIASKWVELLRELAPGVRSVAYLTDRANPGEMLVFRGLEDELRALGVRARVFAAVGDDDVRRAFDEIAVERIGAVIVATSASLLPHRRQIVEAVSDARLPAIYARKEYVEAGGLVAYGTDFHRLWRRAAEYVDRILRGTRPDELPFEMAATFSLVVNMRTARVLAIDIPQAIRLRADETLH